MSNEATSSARAHGQHSGIHTSSDSSGSHPCAPTEQCGPKTLPSKHRIPWSHSPGEHHTIVKVSERAGDELISRRVRAVQPVVCVAPQVE